MAVATYTYTAHGGPLDGQVIESRYPKGFLLVDKPEQKVWIYHYIAEDAANKGPFGWVCCLGSPHGQDDLLQSAAANGFSYDVRAFDGDA